MEYEVKIIKHSEKTKEGLWPPCLKSCLSAFESFKQQWVAYLGAIDVWTRNFQHVEQLYDYVSAIRKVMYTTNAIESILPTSEKQPKKEHSRMRMLY